MPIPGNLFSENTQSFEDDLSGWDISGPVDASRVQGQVVPDAGSWMLRLESDGSGDIVLETANHYDVDDDDYEFLASGWIATANRTQEVEIEIVWWDDDEEIGTTVPGTEETIADGNSILIYSSTGHRPSDAVSASVRITIPATSSGQVTYIDQMFLGPAPNDPRNYLSYIDFALTRDIAGWTSDAPVARIMQPFFRPLAGWALALEPEESGTIEVRNTTPQEVEAGQTYRFAATMVVSSSDGPGGVVYYVPRLRWLSGNLDVISNGGQWAPSRVEAEEDPGVVSGRIRGITEEAPPGASYVELCTDVQFSESTSPSRMYLSEFVFGDPDTQYELVAHDDRGYIELTDVWTGGNTGETLDRVTVTRYHSDGSNWPVRGYGGDWVDVPITPQSTVFVEDYEAPLGERVRYVVTRRSEDGDSSADTSTSYIRGPVLEDHNYIWFKSPGLPARNVRLMVADPITWSYAARSTQYSIVGRARPISVSDVRSSGEGEISLYAWTSNEAERIRAALAPGTTMLIQAMPGLGIEPNLYISVGDATRTPLGSAADPYWIWALPIIEEDRPTGGIQGSAGRTWEVVDDEYSSWSEVRDEYASWSGVRTGDGNA